MSVEKIITQKLTDAFSPSHFAIENESHLHHAGKGAESHFKVTIVSEKFIGTRAVNRHREVYATLAQEFDAGLHALALHLFTPEEWQQCGGEVIASPNCNGIGH